MGRQTRCVLGASNSQVVLLAVHTPNSAWKIRSTKSLESRVMEIVFDTSLPTARISSTCSGLNPGTDYDVNRDVETVECPDNERSQTLHVAPAHCHERTHRVRSPRRLPAREHADALAQGEVSVDAESKFERSVTIEREY